MTDDEIMQTGDIATLEAERHRVAKERAPIWAQYGPGGSWEYARKHWLSATAAAMRLERQAKGEKVTEAALDEAAHADAGYKRMIDECYTGREKLAQLDAQIALLDGLIRLRRDEGFRRET